MQNSGAQHMPTCAPAPSSLTYSPTAAPFVNSYVGAHSFMHRPPAVTYKTNLCLFICDVRARYQGGSGRLRFICDATLLFVLSKRIDELCRRSIRDRGLSTSGQSLRAVFIFVDFIRPSRRVYLIDRIVIFFSLFFSQVNSKQVLG